MLFVFLHCLFGPVNISIEHQENYSSQETLMDSTDNSFESFGHFNVDSLGLGGAFTMKQSDTCV